MKVTRHNWPSVAYRLAYPYDPGEYNTNAMRQGLAALGNRLYVMPPIPKKFKCYTGIKPIQLETESDRLYYATALARYERERARITEQKLSSLLYLVEDLKLRQAAEELKAPVLTKEAYHCRQEGFAPVIGLSFKLSVVKCVNSLVHDYGVDPSKISIIWGGFSKKQRQRFAASSEANLDEDLVRELMLDGLLDEVLDRYADKNHSDLSTFDQKLLKTPTPEVRWEQVKNFRHDKTEYAFFTLGAGGVALSLHDTTGRYPRRGLLSLAYSDKQTVQLTGRAHRVNSASDTYQHFYVYQGTREVKVARRCTMKLRSLQLSSSDDFSDMMWDDIDNDPDCNDIGDSYIETT